MRLCSLRVRGVTTFTQPAFVAFDALGPGLVAFVGPNGAGKSSFIESAAGAIYKAFPSRSGWYEHCHGRDAYIEAVFEDAGGHEVKARVQIDTDARKTEGYLFVDGEPVTTGRSKEFEQQIEQRFGSWDLFLSSTFAAQNKAGNFLLLPRAQRKSLFVELLGLTRLEDLHEQAKTARQKAEADLQIARAAVERVGADVARLPELEHERDKAMEDVADATCRLAAAREAEEAAQAAAHRARTAREQLQSLEQVVSSTMRAVTAARAEVDNAAGAIPTARRAAEARLTEVRVQNPDQREQRATDNRDAALKRIESRRRSLNEQIGRADAVEKAKAELAEAEKEQADLTTAEREARDLRSAYEKASVEAKAAGDHYGRARQQHERSLDELSQRAGLLSQAPCSSASSWQDYRAQSAPQDLAGKCPLIADAQRAKADLQNQDEAERQLSALQTAATVASTAAIEAERRAREAQKVVNPNRVMALDVRIKRLRNVASEEQLIESARQQLAGLEQDVAGIEEMFRSEMAEVAAVRERIKQQEEAIDLELTDALIAAEERALAAKKVLEAACAEYEAAKQKVADFTDATSDPTTADEALDAAKYSRATVEQQLRAADNRRATSTAMVDQLQGLRPQAEAAEAAARAAEQEVGDWTLVERALGRDGIQALEIDAAGPEVARLTNELLEACYGPRFSISFETLREKKSSPGEYIEAFDVTVYDRGIVRPAEALSGGERVVVGEALGLAMAIFNARKSGIHWQTAFRDETCGALDPENAQRYVDLLRKAMAMGGLHQIVFVSHSPEVWARADARLMVSDGTVSLEGAALASAAVESVA